MPGRDDRRSQPSGRGQGRGGKDAAPSRAGRTSRPKPPAGTGRGRAGDTRGRRNDGDTRGRTKAGAAGKRPRRQDTDQRPRREQPSSSRRASQGERSPRAATGSPRGGRSADARAPELPPEEGPRSWGGVARRGAGRLKAEDDETAAAIWRKTVREARPADGRDERPPARPVEEEEFEIIEVREVAADAVGRGRRTAEPRRAPRSTGRRRRAAPPVDTTVVRGQLLREVGPTHAPRLAERLAEAGKAFSRGRYDDARRILRPMAQRAPGSAAVRELYGLTLYRLGKWRDAARELEQFRLFTNSTEQHPVLADSYRALGRYVEVEELWRELKEASPSAALVAEGRIVMAGALADQDRLGDAIRLMEQGVKFPKRTRDHHLRMWYVLADLYDRAGDTVRARQLFQRVAEDAPDFGDAASRLRGLR